MVGAVEAKGLHLDRDRPLAAPTAAAPRSSSRRDGTEDATVQLRQMGAGASGAAAIRAAIDRWLQPRIDRRALLR